MGRKRNEEYRVALSRSEEVQQILRGKHHRVIIDNMKHNFDSARYFATSIK